MAPETWRKLQTPTGHDCRGGEGPPTARAAVTELFDSSRSASVADPLQPRYGCLRIKQEHGKQLVLMGGFSTQRIIRYGTKSPASRIAHPGEGRGYTLLRSCPMPLENVLTIRRGENQ